MAPELTQLFNFFPNAVIKIVDKVNDHFVFEAFGITVPFYILVIGFIIISFAITMFWKGAKR